MIVDDAVVVRHVLKDALSKDSELEVVGTAVDGNDALEKLPRLKPDVVILDIEMPNRTGLETLPEIKRHWPNTIVIMFSTLTSRGATATLDALVAGADDYVTKPSNTGSMLGAIERINIDLIPKIKGLAQKRIARLKIASTGSTGSAGSTGSTGSKPSATALPAQSACPIHRSASKARPQILAIAVSTGGPNALATLIPQLPADLNVPIVIVQHIPPVFSKALADRLHIKSPLAVSEGEQSAVVLPGQVWIAPGDFHMTVERHAAHVSLVLNQAPSENSCRPAADVLFRSVANVYGAATLALVLTGMGHDGQKGAEEIVRAGGRVIAQDEATSVVWGMPGAVVHAGIAEEVLPLDKIGQAIVSRVGTKSSTPHMPARP